MSWQKKARAVIATFVIVFIAIVVVALRHRKPPPAAAAVPERRDKDCVLENNQSGEFHLSKNGKVVFSMKYGLLCTYADGRTRLGNGVEITATKNDKPFTIVSRDAEIVQSGDELKTGHFTKVVKLTSECTEIATLWRRKNVDHRLNIVVRDDGVAVAALDLRQAAEELGVCSGR